MIHLYAFLILPSSSSPDHQLTVVNTPFCMNPQYIYSRYNISRVKPYVLVSSCRSVHDFLTGGVEQLYPFYSRQLSLYIHH
jgi:hypothetical protein